MTQTTDTPTDPLADAIARALAAAEAATDAAHEAEAVLLARNDAAKSMDRTAKRAGLMAIAASVSAIVVIGLGGLVWLRSGADLRAAADVQAIAATGFIERLAEMNGTLDRFDTLLVKVDSDALAREDRLNALLTSLEAQAEHQASAASAQTAAGSSTQGGTMDLDTLRAEILAAIATSEMSIAERLATMTKAAPVAPAPAVAPAAPPRPARRSAQKPAPKPEINHFRFP